MYWNEKHYDMTLFALLRKDFYINSKKQKTNSKRQETQKHSFLISNKIKNECAIFSVWNLFFLQFGIFKAPSALAAHTSFPPTQP
jgi:hypothetical protein